MNGVHGIIFSYEKSNGLRELTLFLLKDCCGGSTELCAPLIAELAPCCSPEAKVS